MVNDLMPEHYYKWILALLILLSGVIRFSYELRYQRMEKILSYMPGREKWFVLIFALCFFLPGSIYIFTDLLSFASFEAGTALRISGAALMLANILFFLWIHISLGKNWSPVLEINKEQTLITSGPYSRIRHPMYLCFFIHAASLWILTANHLIGAAAIMSFAVIYSFRVSTEEQMMLDRFGDEYRAYMKRTGRLLPRL
jgi:protein-S-isoprenylcysteine O-methyltransferase Ste14